MHGREPKTCLHQLKGFFGVGAAPEETLFADVLATSGAGSEEEVVEILNVGEGEEIGGVEEVEGFVEDSLGDEEEVESGGAKRCSSVEVILCVYFLS